MYRTGSHWTMFPQFWASIYATTVGSLADNQGYIEDQKIWSKADSGRYVPGCQPLGTFFAQLPPGPFFISGHVAFFQKIAPAPIGTLVDKR